MTAGVALAGDESGNLPVSSQMMTFHFVWYFFLSVWQVQRRQSIVLFCPHFLPSLSLHPCVSSQAMYVSAPFLFNLACSIELSFPTLLCLA